MHSSIMHAVCMWRYVCTHVRACEHAVHLYPRSCTQSGWMHLWSRSENLSHGTIAEPQTKQTDVVEKGRGTLEDANQLFTKFQQEVRLDAVLHFSTVLPGHKTHKS